MACDEVEHVVLAGGSSRLSFVPELIRQMFGDGKLFNNIPEETIISYGAAIRAAEINGDYIKSAIDFFADVSDWNYGISVSG